MATPDWEALGKALEAARGPHRKANQVARELGISGKQLRNYERAIPTSGRPSAQRLMDLAKLYGVPVEPWFELAGIETTEVFRVTVQPGGAAAMHLTVVDPAAAGPELFAVSDDDLVAELQRRLRARMDAIEGRPATNVVPLSPPPGRPSAYDAEKDVADGSEREPGEFEGE